MATHLAAGSRQWHLCGTCAQHRPAVVVAKQTISSALHEDQIVHFRPDAAENSKYELQEDRRLEQADIHAEAQIVEMADIVAFMLELDIMRRQVLRHHADIAERVAENISIGILDIVFFPIEFPRVVAIGQRMKREVH